MKASRILLITTTAIAVGTLALILTKKRKVRNMLAEVSDEGYELAHDVLYPLKNQRKKHDGYSPAYL